MKVNVEKLSNLERKLDIEVPHEKVAEALNRVYRDLQDRVTIKGFRKGKAPIDKIKAMYKDEVQQDVVRNLVETHYVQALMEHKLEPLGSPNIEFDNLTEGAPFKFTAQFEIRPEVNIQQFENLPVEKEKLELDEARVATVLENLRQSRAKETPLIIIRPAQKGDFATIDFTGYIDGQLLDNGAGTDQSVELGNSGFIPGFDDAIFGMNVGESRRASLKFPDDYHEGLAGKAVEFDITLKRLGQKTVPELSDEFAKEVGPFANLEELKTQIKTDMVKSEETRIQKDLKSRVVKALVERNPVDVPPALLKEQKKALVADLHKRMEQQGMSHEQFNEYQSKWDDDFEKSAKFIIQSSFLISALAEKLELRANKEDIDQRLVEYASTTGIDPARIKKFYEEPDRLNSLKFQITEEKVVEHLISKAQVREVPKTQLPDLEAEA
jgi:trigger factor